MTDFRVLSIDPGPTHSAFVWFEHGRPVSFGKFANEFILNDVASLTPDPRTVMVIEQVAAMGMAVGAEVFETVFWSGRFCQKWAGQWDRMKRHEVKMHLCGNMRAKDSNIRQVLIDIFGGKEKAIGKKKMPGPLFGMSGDCWSALAIAVTWTNTVAPQRQLA